MPRLVSNPPNPWSSQHVEWLDAPPETRLEVYEEEAKSILAANDSPDLSFRFSVNAYRGCFHGCAYCYARPSHQYLGFGAGTDFERKIVVKTNAPELLAKALDAPRWSGESIVFSGNTDCYQPLEAHYALTRRCLEVCAARGQPVSMITKGALVARDVDVLAALAGRADVLVFFSIPFADPDVARAMEPYAPSPERRFAAMRVLSEAGVPVGISLAPSIPGLNDADVPGLLERAKEAGARRAFLTMLRLSGEVRPVFRERLEAALPLRAAKVWAQVRDVRGGRENDTRWGARMRGEGPRWQVVEDLFEKTCRRLGIETREDAPAASPRPPRRADRQGTLFDLGPPG